MQEGTKITGRPRGRPRKFDAEAVLDQATGVFWSLGFSAATLDEIAAATGLVRPSLANAFGEKKDLYLATLARFSTGVLAQVDAVLSSSDDLSVALTRFYDAAIDVYCSRDPHPGCFVMCTAPVEATEHPEIRQALAHLIDGLDETLEARFARARREGRPGQGASAAASARMAQAVLHSLAIRARSGASKASLRRLARDAVGTLVPPRTGKA